MVRDEITEHTIWWDNNKAMCRAQFETLLKDFMAHARLRTSSCRIWPAAPRDHRLTRVMTEHAWHALFIQNLLIVPQDQTGFAPQFTIIDLRPSRPTPPPRHAQRHGDRARSGQGLVLIGGTHYAGEMKKSVFTS